MSLQLSTIYKGLSLENATYKIACLSYTEKEIIDWVKVYNLILQVNSYTDTTKQYDIEQKTYIFESNLEWLTLTNGYNLLKTLLEFETAIDN